MLQPRGRCADMTFTFDFLGGAATDQTLKTSEKSQKGTDVERS